MKPDVWMIVMPDNPISMYYRGRVEESWKDYNLNFFDAITPENNTKTYLNFGKKHGKIDYSPTEIAVWYSHVELWAKAREKPIIIIEHDALLVEPIPEDLFENDIVMLGHTTKRKLKLPCLAYYLKPDMARTMVNGVKLTKVVTSQPDGSVNNTCEKFGVYATKHVYQIKNDSVGTTIEHNK